VTRTRTTQLKALAPALLRSVRWQPVLVSALASALLLWWQFDAAATPPNTVWLLRAVALLLAVGVAFALDDKTRPTLAAVPTPLWWRVVVGLIGVAAPAGLAWCAALAWVGWRVHGDVPAAALTLEAAALATLVLAVAGGLARWRGTSDPGAVTAPVMLALGLLLPQLPRWVALVVPPGPAWDPAHVRWAMLLTIAVAVLALSLRDPAAPRWSVQLSRNE
jgi:fluoroquinolone transport system permease protein